jgi:hypothetical protein
MVELTLRLSVLKACVIASSYTCRFGFFCAYASEEDKG